MFGIRKTSLSLSLSLSLSSYIQLLKPASRTTHNLYQLIERNRKYGRTDDVEMTELFGPQQQDTVGQLAKVIVLSV